jgi:hypothetical protein
MTSGEECRRAFGAEITGSCDRRRAPSLANEPFVAVIGRPTVRSTLFRRAGLAVLALGLMAMGCDNDHHSPTSAELSQSVISDVQIRPLTGQFSDRNVQYRITSNVTKPEGLVGGTAELKASAAERRRQSLGEGQVVAQTPIKASNLSGNQLRVTLNFNRPPVGVMHLLFLVVDARGLESNSVPLVIGIDEPPPPPPPPAATFGETLGATFQHPRCTNCHGFNVPNTTGLNHAARPPTCSLCHTVPGWHAPAASFDLAGLSSSQACNLIKTKQGNNAAVIEDHLKTDLLIHWAITDGTVLGNLQPGGTAPPGNASAWNQNIDRWIQDGLKCQ